MATLARWPLCLGLPVGGGELMLPAALVEQVLPCERVVLSAQAVPGWHAHGRSSGGALMRVRFVIANGEPEAGWTACRIALLRRAVDAPAASPRIGLLLRCAPALLPPLDDTLAMLPQAQPQAAVGMLTVRVAGRRLVVPDMTALPGSGRPS